MALHAAQLVLACVAFEKEKAQAVDLCRFVSLDHEESLKKELGKLSQEGTQASERGELFHKLLAFRRSEKRLTLKEIHPGWILERLKEESPYVLAMICRYLPENSVRYLTSHCDPEVQSWLKQNQNGLIFPDELTDWILTLLEESFTKADLPERKEEFSFAHLGLVAPTDLNRLFCELGMEECCRIFQGTPLQVLSVLLRRLPVEQAREFRDRLREAKELPADVRHQTRLDFLKLPLESSSEDFFLEVGLAVFARAISKKEKNWAQHIVYKMEPRHGYLLRRLISESLLSGHDSEHTLKQEYVLFHFAKLMRSGQTEQTYWTQPVEDEDTRVLEEEAA